MSSRFPMLLFMGIVIVLLAVPAGLFGPAVIAAMAFLYLHEKSDTAMRGPGRPRSARSAQPQHQGDRGRRKGRRPRR